MSVVAAKVYEDKIVMASDSILVYGSSKVPNDFVKMNRCNEMIIGGCGAAEELSLMWSFMKTHKPESSNERDVLNFIIEFSKWKKDLIGDGYIRNEYLIIYKGHLFHIENMLVYEVNSYFAIGAGMDFANAAMYLGHSPKEAVEVACKLSCYVSEPILEFEEKRNVTEKVQEK